MLRRRTIYGGIALPLSVASLFVVGTMLSGCGTETTPVAHVNGDSISQDDYLSLLEMQQSPMGGGSLGKTTLNNLIEQKLLQQEAKRQGVAPTDQELQTALQNLRSNPAFQEELKRTGLSEERIMRLLLAPQLAMTRLLGKMAKVTDKDIRQHFEKNKAQYREPAQAQARVLQFDDKKKADRALQLSKTTNFEAIAQAVGGGSAGGRLETFQKGGFSPYPQPVVDAVFKLKKGETSGVIAADPAPNPMTPKPATGKQYYLATVESQTPPREPNLNDPLLKSRITMSVIQEKSPQSLSPTALQDLIAKLRKEAAINVVRPSVKSVEKGVPAPAMPGMGP